VTKRKSDELVTTSGAILAPEGDLLAVIEGELAQDPRLASAHSRRTYRGALADFENWRAGRPVTKTLVEAYATHLRDRGQAGSTINHKLAAVRWWVRRMADRAADEPGLRAAKRRDIIAQAERAASVANVKGEAPQRGRHVPDGEIRALLQACAQDDRPAGVRDCALIAFAFGTGARRAEIAGLELADVAQAENGDGYEVTIRGKGNKTRQVSVYGGAGQYLADWLAIRGDAPGPLFLAILKSGEILAEGLSTQALYSMLKRRAAEAGIAALGWHDARRTYAGELLDAGVDLAMVQRILGHASPSTTAGYDRRPDTERRKAQRRVTVPYLRR
jgi:site-specific recombinase XerD